MRDGLAMFFVTLEDRALGEVSDEEPAALRARARPGRTALLTFDQVAWDGSA